MEKDSKQIKWWSSLDGDLSEQEQKAFEKEMAENKALAQQFMEAKELDAELKQMEADEPSMRFSKNLLEQLPQLYRRVNIEPLFQRKALTRGGLFLAIVAMITLSPAFFVETEGLSGTPPVWEQWLSFLNHLDPQWISMIAFLCSGFILYFFADQQLKKQLLKRKMNSLKK